MSAWVVAYVPDLMDRSRLGHLAPTFAASPGQLQQLVDAATGTDGVVLVDLARPGVLEVAGQLAASGVRVVGFAPHVDDELRDAAVAAGVAVVARSRFFGRLDEVLRDR